MSDITLWKHKQGTIYFANATLAVQVIQLFYKKNAHFKYTYVYTPVNHPKTLHANIYWAGLSKSFCYKGSLFF